MNLRVGIETGFEGRTLAWALEQPGCLAYGADSDQAANVLVAAFADYDDWIAQHDPAPWLEAFIPEIRVEETWEVYTIDEGYELAFLLPQLPEEPFQRLEVVRQRLIEQLPLLAGSRQVAGVDGEFWCPPKLLRRAVWHERDLTLHIRKLTQGQSSR